MPTLLLTYKFSKQQNDKAYYKLDLDSISSTSDNIVNSLKRNPKTFFLFADIREFKTTYMFEGASPWKYSISAAEPAYYTADGEFIATIGVKANAADYGKLYVSRENNQLLNNNMLNTLLKLTDELVVAGDGIKFSRSSSVHIEILMEMLDAPQPVRPAEPDPEWKEKYKRLYQQILYTNKDIYNNIAKAILSLYRFNPGWSSVTGMLPKAFGPAVFSVNAVNRMMSFPSGNLSYGDLINFYNGSYNAAFFSSGFEVGFTSLPTISAKALYLDSNYQSNNSVVTSLATMSKFEYLVNTSEIINLSYNFKNIYLPQATTLTIEPIKKTTTSNYTADEIHAACPAFQIDAPKLTTLTLPDSISSSPSSMTAIHYLNAPNLTTINNQLCLGPQYSGNFDFFNHLTMSYYNVTGTRAYSISINNNKNLTEIIAPQLRDYHVTIANCPNLSLISLNNCQNINGHTFYNKYEVYPTLQQLYIPKVKELGYGAFYSTPSLTSITMPCTTSIGSSCFEYSPLLRLDLENPNSTTYLLPSISIIGDYCFYASPAIGSQIWFPQTLWYLGKQAFTTAYEKSNIKRVVFDRYKLESPVQFLGFTSDTLTKFTTQKQFIFKGGVKFYSNYGETIYGGNWHWLFGQSLYDRAIHFIVNPDFESSCISMLSEYRAYIIQQGKMPSSCRTVSDVLNIYFSFEHYVVM